MTGIFPIRCMTCGKVIGDLYNHYKTEVEKNKTDDNIININAKKIEMTHSGKVMDKLGLKRLCCRRHMISHADLIDTIG